MKILIAEDDANILNGLAEIFHEEGYTTVTAGDGKEALELYEKEKPDFICLDIMMPGLSGYDVCREIRKSGGQAPVIFISAKSEEVDKVLGLELGADDYITKPFGIREVTARIRAVTRRYLSGRENHHKQSFQMGDLEVAPAELRARRGEQVIELSLRDTRILQLLHDNRGMAVDRRELYRRAWGIDCVPNSRTIDQHISQLRKRIEVDSSHPVIIRTVHGIGYRFD